MPNWAREGSASVLLRRSPSAKGARTANYAAVHRCGLSSGSQLASLRSLATKGLVRSATPSQLRANRRKDFCSRRSVVGVGASPAPPSVTTAVGRVLCGRRCAVTADPAPREIRDPHRTRVPTGLVSNRPGASCWSLQAELSAERRRPPEYGTSCAPHNVGVWRTQQRPIPPASRRRYGPTRP